MNNEKGNKNLDIKDINILEDLNDVGQKAPVKADVPSEKAVEVRKVVSKLDVPEDDVLKKSIAGIRDVYAEKYKSSDAKVRHDLAVEFLSEAKKKEHTPAVQYAFFMEAIQNYAYAGDVAGIMKAIGELDSVFRINRIEFTEKELASCEKYAKVQNDQSALAEAYAGCYSLALENDLYDAAAKYLNSASIYAKKANNNDLMNEIRELNKDMLVLKKEYALVAGSFEKLKTVPDDPAANSAVGKFYCFTRGNWEKGLPLLAKGQDEKMKQLAGDELKNSVEVPEMTKLADGWWALSEERDYRLNQNELRRRACFWYDKLLPSLASLEKIKVEKKIELACSSFGIKRSSLNLPKGAVLAFNFEKNTIVKIGATPIISDLSGQKNDGIIHGVKFVKGAAGDAAEFNGKDSYIEVKDSKTLALDASLTVEMWLNPLDFSIRRNPYNKCYGGEGTMTIEVSGAINFFTGATGKDAEGGYMGASSSKALLPGKWSHVAVVRDQKANRIAWYFNGELASETPFAMEVKASKLNILIGKGYAGAYSGMIDELAIFNRALSEKEVKDLFNMGKKSQSF
ncbi:MAG: hypothetical protein A2X45_17695 [Lentisphaerae bacterium GWF2_50_93]|nr:MAG: hypothetical protein A2X45_17695 [Lentisphaerae bacterium GWF2_50_93]